MQTNLLDYLDNWSQHSKLVPFIPSSKASICIAGVSITRNVARRLRLAASSPAIEQHIMSKNGWNNGVFRSIDWGSQSTALNTLEYTQELFAIKWAHNLLPTRRHMKRIGQAESDLCPSCFATIETAPHIFTCERRVEWQASFIDSLRKLLQKLHTQPDLKTTLLLGIRAALTDSDYVMPTEDKEACFARLVDSQNAIGWMQLLRGRFSLHWIQLQQAHIDQEEEISSKKFTGARWLKKVINLIWNHLYRAWKLRNADLHGVDSADKELKATAKLRPAIVALYDSAAHLDYMDKRMFELPLQDRLRARSTEQVAWINIVTPTVRQAKAEAAHLLQHTQRDIREFLIRPAQLVPRPHDVQIDEQQTIPRLQTGPMT
jgi:hypothetical protein